MEYYYNYIIVGRHYLQEAPSLVCEVNEFPGNVCYNDRPCSIPVIPVRPVRVSYKFWIR